MNHCPPVICIDETHLYEKYTGVLLVVVAKIVANNVFPLSFAVVESENYRDWSWFIYHVRYLIVPRKEGITLISNWHAAILRAIKDYWERPRDG